MKEFIVKIKTLTPTYTEEIFMKNSIIQKIGIIGNLGLWYNTLVRRLNDISHDSTHVICNIIRNEFRYFGFSLHIYLRTTAVKEK